MKEYKIIRRHMVGDNGKELELEINKLAKKGWKVICNYDGIYLILEREKRRSPLFSNK